MQVKKQIGIVVMAALSLTTLSCSSSREASQETTKPATTEVKRPGVAVLPQAIVYRTNSDYINLVPVTLSDDGATILSYPDPSDVKGDVTPIALDNGYLLDRRGINRNTAYLDYTYEEYAALESAPSVKELMEHIIAKNAITEIYRLPIAASEAIGNPASCNEFVANGFEGCTQVK